MGLEPIELKFALPALTRNIDARIPHHRQCGRLTRGRAEDAQFSVATTCAVAAYPCVRGRYWGDLAPEYQKAYPRKGAEDVPAFRTKSRPPGGQATAPARTSQVPAAVRRARAATALAGSSASTAPRRR